MPGVSSLMCAATLIVARHADAEYVDKEFSDEGGTLSVEGRAQATQLAERVRDRRVAHVWCSDAARAVQTAEIVASRLGVSVTTRKTLREVDIGDLHGEPFSVDELCAVTDRWFEGDLDARFPGGESGHDVVARYGAALAEIADLHRGETVVVVTHEKAACIALPSLARNATPHLADRHRLDNGESAELVVDGDDWALARWGDVPPA
jgi:2,3-bisphosphoglycerate-dependent phosphoglycerate mutase